MRKEIILCGNGGQGLLIAGVLLGEAAALYDDLNVTQTQTYGVQARGGESASEVIISDSEINYAEIENPDILVALSQSALNAYSSKLKDGAAVIVDSELVTNTDVIKNKVDLYSFPITKIAMDTTNKAILANIVALGVLSALTEAVSPDSMKKEVVGKAPEGAEEMNMKAFNSGFQAGLAKRRTLE